MTAITKGKSFSKLKIYIKTEKGLTQEELADAIGMERSVLNSRLNGKTEFKLKEVKEICLFLNISSDEFFLNPKVSFSTTFPR